jgi:hypothetical protein
MVILRFVHSLFCHSLFRNVGKKREEKANKDIDDARKIETHVREKEELCKHREEQCNEILTKLRNKEEVVKDMEHRARHMEEEAASRDVESKERLQNATEKEEKAERAGNNSMASNTYRLSSIPID